MGRTMVILGKILWGVSYVWSIIIAWHCGILATLCAVFLPPFAQIYWGFVLGWSSGFGVVTILGAIFYFVGRVLHRRSLF